MKVKQKLKKKSSLLKRKNKLRIVWVEKFYFLKTKIINEAKVSFMISHI